MQLFEDQYNRQLHYWVYVINAAIRCTVKQYTSFKIRL